MISRTRSVERGGCGAVKDRKRLGFRLRYYLLYLSDVGVHAELT